jgi:hypothetical protein
MKKILTITLHSIVTEWGDGVTANDVIAMCEYAEGEAQYELDLTDIDDEDLDETTALERYNQFLNAWKE